MPSPKEIGTAFDTAVSAVIKTAETMANAGPAPINGGPRPKVLDISGK